MMMNDEHDADDDVVDDDDDVEDNKENEDVAKLTRPSCQQRWCSLQGGHCIVRGCIAL